MASLKKNIFLLALMSITALAVSVFSATFVQAQDEIVQLEATEGALVAPSPSASTEAIETIDSDVYIKTPESARARELTDLYQAQMVDYREKERLYQLAKGQMDVVLTLAAIEEAVDATREVQIIRDRVLITYLELLTVTLDQSTGIELTLKQLSMDKLTQHTLALKKHLDETEVSDTRENVNTRSDEFTSLAQELKNDAAQAQSLIALGRLQTVVDRAQILYGDVQEAHEQQSSVSAIHKAQRERAYAQVEQTHTLLNDSLRKTRESLDERGQRRPENYTFNYSGTVSQLSSTYANISQYLSYIRELILEDER